ncbi:helix-turn-helix transcriptional regulator [Nocardia heshunensis]
MSTTATHRFKTPVAPANHPAALPEPTTEDLKLEAVLAVMGDPLRLYIVRKLLLDRTEFDHTCSWFGIDRPKSTLTHHFKALRNAGVLRQRQYGLERRSQVRIDDLETRFPGLLNLIADWPPHDVPLTDN